MAVPLAVVFFVLGFVVGMEFQRGPNWRLELDEYVEDRRLPEEIVWVEEVRRARRPQDFTPGMGLPADEADLVPTFPPRAVRCVVLRWMMPMDDGAPQGRSQVVFVVRHSDGLYRVGWRVYEGPEPPFEAAARADLERIGCGLDLDSR